ncbi:hypothetical protein A8W25_31330 [Streptomyces sp. ERV7]|uniref:AMIN-like domain-containing (lipo)protein n=1 Tax=Streptomyces sp. ERV7 TaxID=1322334 RepID=UPI0007F51E07|nr:hypothetical protein [Streptomyces sp. ERV7]OAR26692.1 hypothetical protein A8W25_31330 [Streptomyces sp. ERV7]
MPKTRIIRQVSAVGAAVAGLVLAGPAPAQAGTTTPATSCQNICVLDARTGAHSDFDRLVFDLSGTGLPQVQATASADGTYHTAGDDEIRHLQIPGKSYLLLDVSGGAVALPSGPDAYTTPRVQSVSLPSLKGVEMAAGYEGHVTFGLSLGDYSQYKVFTLTSPNRVVVDVYH